MNAKKKISCKGVQKKQNDKNWKDYHRALFGKKPEDITDKTVNSGFQMDNGKLITYVQHKLGLSGLYDKRRVLEDLVYMEVLY